MSHNFTVVKASGEKAPFSEEKFRRSLRRIGINEDEISDILNELKPSLFNGVTTKEIYKKTYEILKRRAHLYTGKYNLKSAIKALGPSGYPFEKYVAAIFKAWGFTYVITDQVVMGHCVQHEIDVVAEKKDLRIMVECKFHLESGIKTAVKIPLYVKARFDDLMGACKEQKACSKEFHEFWLVTNTKFTTDAIQYGECVKMKLLAWSYPQDRGIERIIDELKLYPVTVLNHLLSSNQILSLINLGIILCKDLLNNFNILDEFGLPSTTLNQIKAECKFLAE